jgi:exodeoxyribonuclease V alpha subunit
MSKIATYFSLNFAHKSEDQKLLFSLMEGAQAGHTCIKWENNAHLAEDLCHKIQDPLKDKDINTALCSVDDTIYYLTRFFKAEQTVALYLKKLLEETPALLAKKMPLIPPGLFKEQEGALLQILKNSFMILTGGPGTGKTFTAKKMVEALLYSLDEEDKKSFKIAVTAPTGKAAKHLSDTMQSLEVEEKVQGMTLHALLNKNKKIPHDLILVDEASMIDVEMLAKLFSSVKQGARLVLIGDPKQLPPVEAGAFFTEIVKMLEGRDILVQLKQCVRIEDKTLYNFAEALRQKDQEKALSALFHSSATLQFVPLEEIGESPYSQKEKVVEAFFSSKDRSFCILTPLKQGVLGVDSLNNAIKEQWNQPLLPILALQNDPTLKLMNGDKGFLDEKEKKAFFSHLEEAIPEILLPKYAPAFALSVHKSQGSEFDEILLLLPKGSECFGMEMLYTAVTRAKKKVIIWGDLETIKKMLANFDERQSGFNFSVWKDLFNKTMS